MASTAALGDIPSLPPSRRQYYFRRIGDRLELKVTPHRGWFISGIILQMCFAASFTILFTGKSSLVLLILDTTLFWCFIPGMLCLLVSFRNTCWLVVGPRKWRAVSGQMTPPDPDGLVGGPFTRQKDGQVHDFISLTISASGQGDDLFFESKTARFWFDPPGLRKVSRIDKEWLAGQIIDFMNEMKVDVVS
ncbi:hypothetical protein Vafri_11730 [Volvox africanus]|uniref:Uncharacterized protein n=1 Tax=Volvox africanus TaxID=51714 RepID=A0A8J4F1Z9_9CHLO|nr:hypothetical protein Vafri_11730 [Volvox africanus]